MTAVGPLAKYERRVAGGELVDDAAQKRIVTELDRLHREIVDFRRPGQTWRRLLGIRRKNHLEPVRGVYVWGSVGRGKTYLMDLFYGCLPFEDKLRQHFHRFMASVHNQLKQLRDRQDPLEHVADHLADRARIICFDELAVTDIADAMILGTLFKALFDRGVSLAATSNIEPVNLYKDGLQRQRFEPAIALLEHHTRVLRVGGDTDYRLQFMERANIYKRSTDSSAERELRDFFIGIAPDAGVTDGKIDILGRGISYKRRADGIIWFDFEAICDGPRSQDDYIELSRCFHTVLISNVPCFDRDSENQARRFIALVDEFYDRKVKVVLSAEAPVATLYGGYKLGQDFERTQSRLEEMQSHDYLAAPHRP